MKNKKETAPTTEKERENFWLEIGPASAYYGTDSYETAKEKHRPQRKNGRTSGWRSAPPAPITAQILTRPRKKTAMPARTEKPGGLKARSQKKGKINLWQRYDAGGQK